MSRDTGKDMRLSFHWLTFGRTLSAVLLLDGLIAVGFGLTSSFAPRATFGTIVDIRHAGEDSLILAALAFAADIF